LGAAATLTSTDPGTVTTPVLICDDSSSAGYSETSSLWQAYPGGGYSSECRRHAPLPTGATPTGTDFAVWTFTNFNEGWYQIEATWPAVANQTSAAQYTVVYQAASGGSTTTPFAAANQRIAPSGDTYNSAAWTILNTLPIYFSQGTITVKLNGETVTGVLTAGYVAADAVRLVPTANTVTVTSCNKSVTSGTITANATVAINPKIP
jgi:hypothetical protein